MILSLCKKTPNIALCSLLALFNKAVIEMPVCLYRLFNNCLFHLPGKENTVFITFDDGPDPELTPGIVELLDKYNAKATFFCLGHKVKENPRIINHMRERGHGLANHGYYHLRGRNCTREEYIENVEKAKVFIPSRLFRPPYGRISPLVIRHLRKSMQIVFYTLVAKDYDLKYSDDKITGDLLKKVRPGSIIVLHDVKREGRNTLCILQKLLEYVKINGWEAKRLPESMD